MQPRFLVDRLPAPGKPATLDEGEAHHARKVLRLGPGDRVMALDGQGGAAWAEVLPGKEMRLGFVEPARGLVHDEVAPLTLEMAVIKADPYEWAIEKCVEMGVRRFVPLLTDRTVVKTGAKGPETFQRKWQKLADQALKQCGRLHRMTVEAPVELGVHLAREAATASEPRIWCDEATAGDAAAPHLASLSLPSGARIAIGPEGGWSEGERTLLGAGAHHHRVRLGPLVLRADTAALYAASILHGCWQTGQRPLDKAAR
ncbi:MAG TPA: RsmE family RNA methyltransferase [Bdellovibrionota bacterium]|jgi:16S rRNA (uracil1498-N3)-methyltransferase|nr:RsmE family RNA methyltransferase [Bdellovibrionota bacterium]